MKGWHFLVTKIIESGCRIYLLQQKERYIVYCQYQLPVTKLRSLQKEVVDTKIYVKNSPEYKLVAIILDVAKFRLYKPVQTVSPKETPTRDFLKLDFRNKGRRR